MFIFARLIGVSVFSFALILVCLMIARTDLPLKALLWLYIGALSVMGFFYVPASTADLFRIRQMMELFSSMELLPFFRTYAADSSVPTARLLYWLAGKAHIPGLLPALACCISYGCIFYILADSANRHKSSRTDIAVALFFILSAGQFIFVVSNIRTMIAVALVCFCAYRETVVRKYSFWHLILYGFAVTIHTFAFVVLILRLLIPVLNRSLPLWKRAATAALVLVFLGGAFLLVPRLFAEVMRKIQDYIIGHRYSYFWDYLIGVIALALQLYILRLFFRKPSLDLGGFGHLLTLCILTACLFCFDFSIFHRIVIYVCPILSAPLLLECLSRTEDANGSNETRRTWILAMALCMLVLSCARGSLCGLKFF